MNRIFTSTLVLISAAGMAGCAAYRAQHQPQPAPPVRAATATAPVAERADTNQQIVDQFARESAGEKQATLLSQLDVYKEELAEQGKYDCCVRPGCNECVLQRGECHCRVGVEQGAPCCGECTAAWIDGRGDVPGIDKEEILKNLGCYRELYEGGTTLDQGSNPSGSAEHHHHD